MLKFSFFLYFILSIFTLNTLYAEIFQEPISYLQDEKNSFDISSSSVSLSDQDHSWIQKKAKSENIPTPYVRNTYVDSDLWDLLSPYFLPYTFPEKAILDRIFSKRRVLSSTDSMNKAGFLVLTDPKNKIIVAAHPKLRGYLIKVYLDDDKSIEWTWWKKRIDGARVIQESINYHGYESIMTTPQKWIYPLPSEPSPKAGHGRKNFILIVQEMDILNSQKNRKAYKNKMNPTILNALYTVIMENLLIDSIYADNVPFCKDGRLAFIDTEHTLDNTRPVPIAHIAKYLSSDMYSYWEQLIVNGVPP